MEYTKSKYGFRRMAKDFTKEQYLEMHRRFWTGIADLIRDGEKHYSTSLYKKIAYNIVFSDIFLEKYMPPDNMCFCCEYTKAYGKCSSCGRSLCDCSKCFLEWGEDGMSSGCMNDNSPYWEFTSEIKAEYPNFNKLETLAREIANLKERSV